MRQKYEIVRDDDNKRLIIREFAELDKDVMSLLCEETYDKKAIKSAMALGRDTLIAALRTKNLYPPGMYAGKIAETVVELYGAKDKTAAFDHSAIPPHQSKYVSFKCAAGQQFLLFATRRLHPAVELDACTLSVDRSNRTV